MGARPRVHGYHFVVIGFGRKERRVQHQNGGITCRLHSRKPGRSESRGVVTVHRALGTDFCRHVLQMSELKDEQWK